NAHALSFYSFMRSFAGVWGVTLGGAILQNQLQRRLPQEFLSQFPEAFVDSLRWIWTVVAGVCGLGLLSTFFMKGLPLHTDTDDAWALRRTETAYKGDGSTDMLSPAPH
ncbi:hypothetical protein K439DRAFT_1378099, partial [Ramaria rubella]